MLTTERPEYIPILLPNDAMALEHLPERSTLLVSAVYSANPRLEPLLAGARERAGLLLVDPKTAHFQFEGYMSMPDYRALPYSPGRGALGTLWEPGRFSRPDARRWLIEETFELQQRMGAGAVSAPYFYIPHPDHPWLSTCREIAEDAAGASTGLPLGVPVCVDIDALIEPNHRRVIADAYRDLAAAFFWVTIVNFDERRADPRDVNAVLAFLHDLQSSGTPTVLSHVGRTGLLAIACGAAGYASGTHGLESHPRAMFREMMGSRPANGYYLAECFFQLGVRSAQACLELETTSAHGVCGCAGCNNETSVARMVSRRLSLHTMLRRLGEVAELCEVPEKDRRAYLIDRFTAALERAPELSAAIEAAGFPPIRSGDYHYLEVLREGAGGAAATIPAEGDGE